MPLEPRLAHFLGIPLEELLPWMLGLGTALTYIRLRLTSSRPTILWNGNPKNEKPRD